MLNESQPFAGFHRRNLRTNTGETPQKSIYAHLMVLICSLCGFYAGLSLSYGQNRYIMHFMRIQIWAFYVFFYAGFFGFRVVSELIS